MKFFKKILTLAVAFVLAFSLGVITACDDNGGNSSSEIVEPVDYVYKVRTQSEGGFGLRNVLVSLYDGETKISSVLTNAQGNAFFLDEDVAQTGTYNVTVSDVPTGWRIKNDDLVYQTSTQEGTTVTIDFTAQLITDEETPSTKLYRLGDVMYDFAVETSDGDIFILSEALTQKKMVLLNFWATWCGPCVSEFPAMQNAYTTYESVVDVIAVSIEASDDQSAVRDFKKQHSLTFPMAGQPAGSVISDHFNTASIPTSVLIDRYGVISYLHTGAITSTADFTNLFDKFINDDYKQTVIDSSAGENGNDNNGSTELAKPTVSPPEISKIDEHLTGDSTTFAYSWETEDEYSWPWVVAETEADGKYISASNSTVDNSYAILNADFEAAANKVLAFDAYISTENKADELFVMIDGAIIHRLSGVPTTKEWKTYYAYVFEAEHAGKHTLSLVYDKDATLSGGDDVVYLKNLRLLDKSVLSADGVDLNIFRYAATGYNSPFGENGEVKELSEAEKTTKYSNYANVLYSTADGYYHVVDAGATSVDIETDPILFVELMNSTHWNMYDLWQLAYNGLLVYEGFNLEEAVEEFAWAATNSQNGYVPVTKELKELLELCVSLDPIGDEYNEQYHKDYYEPKYHKANYDNEWLELCLYFDHYGNTPQMKDPTAGVTFDGAITINEGENHIVCDVSLVPLGIKHKFVPAKSGVYRLYSKVGADLTGSDSSTDPQCWIFAEDRKTELAYSDDFILSPTGNFDNFDISIYMEAGKTYYCLFAFFLNDVGEFDMQIDYLGAYHEVLTNAAIGPYSYNTVTSETFLPGAQKVKYDEATDTYRVTDENGVFLGDKYAGLDDAIYLDLVNTTYLFSSQSLAGIIESAHEYAENKRLFYLPDGKGSYTDYTDEMQKYLFFAYRNDGELYGFTKIDKALMEILIKFTKAYDGFGGITNSWQMMCYYYQPIGSQN